MSSRRILPGLAVTRRIGPERSAIVSGCFSRLNQTLIRDRIAAPRIDSHPGHRNQPQFGPARGLYRATAQPAPGPAPDRRRNPDPAARRPDGPGLPSRLRAIEPEQILTTHMPCPVLVDGRCSAYPARPLNCRSYHSLSREACEASFEDPTDLSLGHPQLTGLARIHEGARGRSFRRVRSGRSRSPPVRTRHRDGGGPRGPGLP